MALDNKNVGLAKRVRAAEVANSIAAYDYAGDPASTAKTKSDQFPLDKRLRKLETVLGLRATSDAKIRRNRMGLENRLRDIEAAS
jgi:hypothetical protein